MVVYLAVLRILLAVGGTGVCRRTIPGDTNRNGVELFSEQQLDLSRIPARRLEGGGGPASFMAGCGLDAVINVFVARDLCLLGAGGAAVGAFLNYALI